VAVVLFALVVRVGSAAAQPCQPSCFEGIEDEADDLPIEVSLLPFALAGGLIVARRYRRTG